MDNEELKTALQNGTPVVLSISGQNEILCERVTAIIYRCKYNRIFVEAEVQDRNNNCVYICNPKDLKEVKKENENLYSG